MPALTRREFVGGLALGCAGCAVGGGASGDTDVADACATDGTAGTGGYCLVEPVRLRARGGARLAVGETMLALLDDNTAVLVARDDGGLFARSAVCTHACCIVMLCVDDTCASLEPAPLPCEGVGPIRTDRVVCPCHGSEFRVSDGAPVNGPAVRALPAYAVSVDGDDVLVDTGAVVGGGARTPA